MIFPRVQAHTTRRTIFKNIRARDHIQRHSFENRLRTTLHSLRFSHDADAASLIVASPVSPLASTAGEFCSLASEQ